MPRIAFFAVNDAMDYHKVGGTNSLVRRLASSLSESGIAAVDYVMYGYPSAYREQHAPGLGSIYCSSLVEALAELETYDHVVILYVRPKDRVRLARFRRRVGKRTVFHALYTSWPTSRWKRWLMTADLRLTPLNGCAFGISPRLAQSLSRWNSRSALLLPPVPKSYFVPPEVKHSGDRLNVCYIGRLDDGKGVPDAIELFNELEDSDENIQLTVCGLHWPHLSASNAIDAQLSEAQLSKERRSRYIKVPLQSDCHAAEEMVGNLLRETDILVQPYRQLSSTIDTPLLILEGMASLVAVITKPYGNIPEVYGASRCLIGAPEWIDAARGLIQSAAEWLPTERERLAKRRDQIGFDVGTVAQQFAQNIGIN